MTETDGQGEQMNGQAIKMHVHRVPPRAVPLLTPDEEFELEQDLVPERDWSPATILPQHKRSRS